MQADSIRVVLSGAGEIELAGNAESVEIDMSGLGRFDAADLESRRVAIDISGGGRIVDLGER